MNVQQIHIKWTPSDHKGFKSKKFLSKPTRTLNPLQFPQLKSSRYIPELVIQYKHQIEKLAINNFIKISFHKYQICFKHSERNIPKLVSKCKHQTKKWRNNFSKVSLPWIPNLLPRCTSFEERTDFKLISRLQNWLLISNIEIGMATLLSNLNYYSSFFSCANACILYVTSKSHPEGNFDIVVFLLFDK